MQKHKVRYTFHILQKGKIVQRYDSSSLGRFRNHIRTIKWQKSNFKVYLKINYGGGYYNNGIYGNRNDLLFTLDAFADPAIPKYLYE